MQTVFALLGKRYGKLLVVGALMVNRRGCVACACDCGSQNLVRADGVIEGRVTTCGCRLITHGLTRRNHVPPEWLCWSGMRRRCRDRNTHRSKNYGDRGLRVCARWQKFENFYADMGNRPSPRHSIERINNNGDYEPDNCEWAESKAQRDNRRITRWIVAHGRRLTITDWSEVTGISRATIANRLKRGWSTDAAVSEPIHQERMPRRIGKKLNPDNVRAIRERASGGENHRELARAFGVSDSAIKQIILRRVWRSVA